MSGLLPLFLSVREQRQFCREPKSALPYFYAVKRFSRAKPTLQKWACQFRSGIHVRQAIWPIHLTFDAVPITRRHSRTGGNPVLNHSELFKDCHHFKLLDSRLCGNDGAWFSDLNLLQNHQIQPAGRTCSLSGNKYQRSSESVASTK